MIDITPVVQAVLALLAALVTAVVVPFVKSRTTASQQAQVNEWVKIAVAAVEQIYNGSGLGEQKKAYVLRWLRERGITVDEKQLNALVEAAVFELNSGLLTIGTPVPEGGYGG